MNGFSTEEKVTFDIDAELIIVVVCAVESLLSRRLLIARIYIWTTFFLMTFIGNYLHDGIALDYA